MNLCFARFACLTNFLIQWEFRGGEGPGRRHLDSALVEGDKIILIQFNRTFFYFRPLFNQNFTFFKTCHHPQFSKRGKSRQLPKKKNCAIKNSEQKSHSPQMDSNRIPKVIINCIHLYHFAALCLHQDKIINNLHFVLFLWCTHIPISR